MGRKRRPGGGGPETDWSTERTLAASEEDEGAESVITGADADVRCACGSDEFLLEAFVHVVGGRARPDFVEVESLTCPACGREYEAIQGEDGRILKGDFVGWTDEEP